MSETVINFDHLTGEGKVRNLAGKERGVAARRDLNVDSLDASSDTVVIKIPAYVDTISPSYFQGLFSESIRTLHGREGFLSKYKFEANANVMQWIELGIRNSISSRDALI